MNKQIAKLISTVLVVIAAAAVTTASFWTFHRPEVPAELLKK